LNKKNICELLKPLCFYIEKPDEQILDIMTDSREVLLDSVFFALSGSKFNANDFIKQALQNGAKLIITEKIPNISCDYIVVENLRKIQNFIASKIYDIPKGKIGIIGITGTNGKTSSTYIVQNMLENIGINCGRAGTINVYTGKNTYKSINTFPDGPLFLRYINESVKSNMKYFVCEVSSQALALKRTENIEFSYGIYTNLTRDHLDFHKNMEDYFLSKKKLFENISKKKKESGFAVNTDCEYGKRLYIEFKDKTKVISFGYNQYCDVKILNVSEKNGLSSMKFEFNNTIHCVDYFLTGDFNAMNVAGCISLLIVMGIDINIIKKACHNILPIPGRLEKVKYKDKNIYVDYAHTPDALQRAILSLRKIYNKVILVFGCGGNRDSGKREIMGKIAFENADFSFITNDNPRYESSIDIVNDILKGFLGENYSVVYNREKAIIQAIEKVQKEDCVLIAGKGHEDYQEINGVKNYFSDRGVIEKYENTI